MDPDADNSFEDVTLSEVIAGVRRLLRRHSYDVTLVLAVGMAVFAVNYDPSGYNVAPAWITDDLLDGPRSNAGEGAHDHTNKPRPIITDIDGDGLNEMISISNSLFLEICVYNRGGHQLEIVRATRLPNYDDKHVKITPVVMNVETYNVPNGTQITLIVVVMSNWLILAYDASTLSQIWSSQPLHLDVLFWQRYRVHSFTALAFDAPPPPSAVNQTPAGERGHNATRLLVIAGHYAFTAAKSITIDNQYNTLTKMWAFCFHLNNGSLVWTNKPDQQKHKKKGFEDNDGIPNYLKYSDEIRELFPHQWSNMFSTSVQPLRLIRPSSDLSEIDVTPCLRKLRKNISDPHNSLAIHLESGIEILHMSNGSHVTRVALPGDEGNSIFADLDCDNVPDRIFVDYEKMQAVAISGDRDRYMFRVKIDETATWKGFFINLAKNIDKEELDPSEMIPTCFPFLLKKEHNALSFIKKILPHNDHMLGYDQYYLTSEGVLTSYNSYGNLNWQVSSYTAWYHIALDLGNSAKAAERTEYFNHFKPSITTYSIDQESQPDILVTGWDYFDIRRTPNGALATSHGLPCRPSQKPLVADFNNDGSNDIIFICTHGYIGYLITKQSNHVYSVCMTALMAASIYFLIWLMSAETIPEKKKKPTMFTNSSKKKRNLSTHKRKR